MLIGGKSGKKWCVGFPAGSCSVRDSGALAGADKEGLGKYEMGFIGDICFSCNQKRGISKRKKKKVKLLHRQNEHELSILKILMSELTVKKSGQSKPSKMGVRKGEDFSGGLEEQETGHDPSVLDDVFKFIQYGNVNDLDQVANKMVSIFRDVDREDPLSQRVWWTQTHILDKSKAGWKEGFTEAGFAEDGKGTGKYVQDKDRNFIEVSSVLDKSLVEIGTLTYNIKTSVIPSTNTRQIQKFLYRLEGVRCEECNRNTYNLSENICTNPECPGRMIDEYGDSVPSTNIKNQGGKVVRKRATLGVSSRKIMAITDHHPNPEDKVQIKNSFIDQSTGKERKDIQNIIWRITREGVVWVALNETLNRFDQKQRNGLDE